MLGKDWKTSKLFRHRKMKNSFPENIRSSPHTKFLLTSAMVMMSATLVSWMMTLVVQEASFCGGVISAQCFPISARSIPKHDYDQNLKSRCYEVIVIIKRLILKITSPHQIIIKMEKEILKASQE